MARRRAGAHPGGHLLSDRSAGSEHAIDVARARAETPGCADVVHLNNAGASPSPRPVVEVVVDAVRAEAREGGYELAERRAEDLDAVYASVARLLGAELDEVALVDSATRAWDGALGALPLGAGDRVLVSRAEYGSSMLALLRLARLRGIEIEVVPDDEHGSLDVGALARLLDDRVRLVAVTHVPTSSGLVNPVEAVGDVVANHDAWYLVDACQSVGQLPVDVAAIGCDLLSATGRKYLRGPRGTGFLYARRGALEALEPTTVDLRSAEWVAPDRYELRADARRFETWERNVAATLGLGTAIDYALEVGIDAIAARVGALARGLRERLGALEGITLRDPGTRRCGIVTFTVAGHDPRTVVDDLHRRGVNVWSSQRSAARLDLEARGLESVVRASVHYFNTDDELDTLVDALADSPDV